MVYQRHPIVNCSMYRILQVAKNRNDPGFEVTNQITSYAQHPLDSAGLGDLARAGLNLWTLRTWVDEIVGRISTLIH